MWLNKCLLYTCRGNTALVSLAWWGIGTLQGSARYFTRFFFPMQDLFYDVAIRTVWSKIKIARLWRAAQSEGIIFEYVLTPGSSEIHVTHLLLLLHWIVITAHYCYSELLLQRIIVRLQTLWAYIKSSWCFSMQHCKSIWYLHQPDTYLQDVQQV